MSLQRRPSGIAMAAAVALTLACGARVAAAAGKGYDTEYAYSMKGAGKAPLAAPGYVQDGGGKLIVSDHDADGGTIFTTAPGGGKPTALGKVKGAAGVAVAPAGFGTHGGEIFVLATADDGNCVIDRLDKSGAVTLFAKLPDTGSAKPTGGRALEFGAAGGPFAGKLYASINGNATVYEITPAGQARAFITFDKPPLEVAGLGFTASNDPKAANAMLVANRPLMPGGARLGKISVVDASGKLALDPYLVGFVRPTAFAYSPANFGVYPGVFFIVDAGKLAGENDGAKDGTIYRVDKGVAHSFATGMVDPTSLRFVGKSMVLADPAAGGKPGTGAIITIVPAY